MRSLRLRPHVRQLYCPSRLCHSETERLCMYRHKAHETHDAGACCADSSTRRLCRGAVSHAITNHTSSKKHHMEGKRHSVLCAHRTLSLSLMLAGCPSIVMGKSNSIAWALRAAHGCTRCGALGPQAQPLARAPGSTSSTASACAAVLAGAEQRRQQAKIGHAHLRARASGELRVRRTREAQRRARHRGGRQGAIWGRGGIGGLPRRHGA